jgi:hypothetical protein
MPPSTDSTAVSALSATPNGPPSGPPPPEAATAYDDSNWTLVDAPHDMLVRIVEFVQLPSLTPLQNKFTVLSKIVADSHDISRPQV